MSHPPPGHARVWLVSPRTVSAERIRRLRAAVLSADERSRMDRLVFAEDRAHFAVAHALTRFALSGCSKGVAPWRWRFAAGDHGRPEIASPPSWLRFNLSHTPGLVGCVVTGGQDCGLDVERLPLRWRDLGPQVLSDGERDWVHAGADAPVRLIQAWTMKEAYTKARGMGMRLRFDECVFDLSRNPIRLVSHPPGGSAQWSFWQRRLPGHVVAVALGASRATATLSLRRGTANWNDWRAGFWRPADRGSAESATPAASPRV